MLFGLPFQAKCEFCCVVCFVCFERIDSVITMRTIPITILSIVSMYYQSGIHDWFCVTDLAQAAGFGICTVHLTYLICFRGSLLVTVFEGLRVGKRSAMLPSSSNYQRKHVKRGLTLLIAIYLTGVLLSTPLSCLTLVSAWYVVDWQALPLTWKSGSSQTSTSVIHQYLI
jgi:hypothetical protein